MKQTKHLTTLLVWLAVLAAQAVAKPPAELTGTIQRFADGDTYWLVPEHGPPVKVREWVADAPELAQRKNHSDQPGAREALAYAKQNWQGKQATVTVKGESYGRVVGETRAADMPRTLGLDLVAGGHAWVYPHARPRPTASHVAAQAKAVQERVGIWREGQDQVTPPWDWRKRQRVRVRDGR